MKSGIIPLLLLAIGSLSCAQTVNPLYNKALADSLGADEYGMKKYVLVILKTGPAKIENKAVTDSLFRGHMAFIQRMANDGKLIVAGPLGKNEKTYRGIYIFDVRTSEEVQVLISNDPSIKAGVFDTEIFSWYGSAALPVYLKIQDKIGKFKI